MAALCLVETRLRSTRWGSQQTGARYWVQVLEIPASGGVTHRLAFASGFFGHEEPAARSVRLLAAVARSWSFNLYRALPDIGFTPL